MRYVACAGSGRRRIPRSATALHGLHPTDLETAFRRHAAPLEEQRPGGTCVAVDGKTLRGSVDRFADQRAIQLLSALSTDNTLVLGHLVINTATNGHRHEIPAAQHLIQELSLSGRVFTLDAQHAQKNGGGHRRHRQ